MLSCAEPSKSPSHWAKICLKQVCPKPSHFCLYMRRYAFVALTGVVCVTVSLLNGALPLPFGARPSSGGGRSVGGGGGRGVRMGEDDSVGEGADSALGLEMAINANTDAPVGSIAAADHRGGGGGVAPGEGGPSLPGGISTGLGGSTAGSGEGGGDGSPSKRPAAGAARAGAAPAKGEGKARPGRNNDGHGKAHILAPPMRSFAALDAMLEKVGINPPGNSGSSGMGEQRGRGGVGAAPPARRDDRWWAPPVAFRRPASEAAAKAGAPEPEFTFRPSGAHELEPFEVHIHHIP